MGGLFNGPPKLPLRDPSSAPQDAASDGPDWRQPGRQSTVLAMLQPPDAQTPAPLPPPSPPRASLPSAEAEVPRRRAGRQSTVLSLAAPPDEDDSTAPAAKVSDRGRIQLAADSTAAGDARDTDKHDRALEILRHVGEEESFSERRKRALSNLRESMPERPDFGEPQQRMPQEQTKPILVGQIGLGAKGLVGVFPTIETIAQNGDRFEVRADAPGSAASAGQTLGRSVPIPVGRSGASYSIHNWNTDRREGKGLPDKQFQTGELPINPFSSPHSTPITIRNLPDNSTVLTKAGMQPNQSHIVHFRFHPTENTPPNTIISLWKLPPMKK